MVSRILISIALLFSTVAMSQDENGLTFSQVLLLDITQEQVVPEGKVWKIVSFLNQSNNSSYNTIEIKINGQNTYLSAGNTQVPHSYPLWLPSGTLIEKYSTYIDIINIIEFNTD